MEVDNLCGCMSIFVHLKSKEYSENIENDKLIFNFHKFLT
jgi:hypothetical protein